MALAFTFIVPPQPFGARRMAIVDVAFDSSYPTGGEAVTADNFGFSQTIDTMLPAVGVASSNALMFAYDPANKKIMAFYPHGGGAAAPTTVAQPAAAATAGAVDAHGAITGAPAKGTLAVASGASTASAVDATTPTIAGAPTAGTLAVPAHVFTQPTITLTPGAAKEVGNTADLSGYTAVRFIAFGL